MVCFNLTSFFRRCFLHMLIPSHADIFNRHVTCSQQCDLCIACVAMGRSCEHPGEMLMKERLGLSFVRKEMRFLEAELKLELTYVGIILFVTALEISTSNLKEAAHNVNNRSFSCSQNDPTPSGNPCSP